MKYCLIGDTHCGNSQTVANLVALCNENPTTTHIVMGDLTFSTYNPISFAGFDLIKNKNLKLIGGNHDDYDYFSAQNPWFYLGDYGMLTDEIGFIRGAASTIDKEFRLTRGYRWFEKEELSELHLNQAIEFFQERQPKIMLSHEAPDFIVSQIHPESKFAPSRTQLKLEELYNELNQVQLWYFGHHHRTFQTKYNNTLFQCLNRWELKYF